MRRYCPPIPSFGARMAQLWSSNVEKCRDLRSSIALALVRDALLIHAGAVMIISCPACDTRYVVPESAIGVDGRTVRCAKCKHSWFQGQEPLDLTQQAEPEPAPAPAAPASNPPAPKPEPEERGSNPPAEPSINHWRTEDHPEARTDSDTAGEGIAARALKQSSESPQPTKDSENVDGSFDQASDPLAGESADESFDEDYAFDDDFDGDQDGDYSDDYDDGEGSHFDYSPPFSRRRNSLKMWTIAAAVFALLATGTVVAVNYYGPPAWLPIDQPTFGIGKDNLELDFPDSQQRLETLDSGEEIYRVRGSISNSGQETMTVPSLLIVFRDERERNVYDWVVVPSKRELAPGESLNVTEAVTDIPASAKAAEIGWSPN